MGRPKHKVQSGFVLFDRLLRRRYANIEPQGAGHRTWWTGRRRPGAHFCRNAGPHDRRDVWHATWTHKDNSTVTKIIITEWVGRIVRRECARHSAIKSARCGQCMGDPPKNTTVL